MITAIAAGNISGEDFLHETRLGYSDEASDFPAGVSPGAPLLGASYSPELRCVGGEVGLLGGGVTDEMRWRRWRMAMGVDGVGGDIEWRCVMVVGRCCSRRGTGRRWRRRFEVIRALAA